MKPLAAEVAIVGAGIVGLACGAELARAGRRVLILERNERPGLETSSRNSQVIHAGIYYPTHSLKALSCVEGRGLLYDRCARLGIAHRRIGKLIVAIDEDELVLLDRLREQAMANGAGEIEWLDRRAIARLEPRVRAAAALWSPNTGIVDAHALVWSYLAEFEAAGGVLARATRVVGLNRRADFWRVETVGPDDARFDLDVSVVVNAAGLASDRLAALAGIDIDARGWRLHFCKGDYFDVAPGLGGLTNHLVYPVPVRGGLGTHVTVDLGGRYRLGPDATYVQEPSYDVDSEKRDRFARDAARYLPEIRPEHLQPGMAGVRPKCAGPGEPFGDFVIEETSALGAPGMVQLIGIESPGLTAAGAIARRVAALV